MDDILKELWAALKTLDGPQWVVLLAIALLIGVGLFVLFRWLYAARLEAQASLIGMKNDIIEHYKGVHSERSKSRTLSAIIPEAWEVLLDQPYEQLDEILKAATQQQTMNYTSANMGFVKDAELYVLYVTIFHSLPSDRAETFKREQEHWLRQRKVYCESSVESHRGTLASLEYSMAFIQRTTERIAELTSREPQRDVLRKPY